MLAIGSESYLEALEGLLGRWGLVLAHCGSKGTDRGGPRKIFLLPLLLSFILFLLPLFLLANKKKLG